MVFQSVLKTLDHKSARMTKKVDTPVAYLQFDFKTEHFFKSYVHIFITFQGNIAKFAITLSKSSDFKI
jgi:hypothetical protein